MSKSKSEKKSVKPLVELSAGHDTTLLKNRKCRMPGCERPINPSRARYCDYICSYHDMIRQHKKRLVMRLLYRSRDHAKQRNHRHSISRRHWFYLNYFTLYWKKKGRHKHTLQIDRIDNAKGYSDDNVQVVDGLYNFQKRQGKDLWEE